MRNDSYIFISYVARRKHIFRRLCFVPSSVLLAICFLNSQSFRCPFLHSQPSVADSLCHPFLEDTDPRRHNNRHISIMGASNVERFGSLKTMYRKMTMTLFMACLITALLNLLFGFDTTSFAGVQSIPAFEREFGTPIGTHKSYALSASRASFISSSAFAGKFLGTLVCTLFHISGRLI